jgi:hypothetical protein
MLSVSVATGQPVAAIEIGLLFEKTMLRRWNPQIVPKNGNVRDKFDQRRMFRVQPVICRFPHHVPGEHVVIFIKSKRFSMHHGKR